MKLDLFLIVFLGIVLYVTLLFTVKRFGWCKKKYLKTVVMHAQNVIIL